MREAFELVMSAGAAAVVRSIIEVLILGYLLYQLILVLRGTRAAPVVVGVALLGALYYASDLLGFGLIHWLIGLVVPYTIIALIVIFQSEIRRTLGQFALQFVPMNRRKRSFPYEYEDVIFAVGHFSQERVGALVVIERETGLRTFVQSGVALDARLSTDLLESIFNRTSPLHDGAVIIQRGRIAAASCFLPLTTNPGLISSLGTRHRAAIGITEESDCLAIVVSETDGRISIAAGGNIELGVSLDRLRERLIQYFGQVVLPPPESPKGDLDNEEEELDTASSAVAYMEGSRSAAGTKTH